MGILVYPQLSASLTFAAYSIPGRVWTFMENIKDTAYDFTLVLRQMYTEEILREKLESVGAPYYQSVQCIDFEIDQSAPLNSFAVTSIFTDLKTQKPFKLKRYGHGEHGGMLRMLIVR